MKITVSELTLLNLSEYRELRLKALVDHPESFGMSYEDFEKFDNQKISSWILNPAKTGGIFLGAFFENNLIGTSVLRRVPGSKCHHRALINGVYVLPEFRSYGVATELFKSLEKFAIDNSLKVLELQVVTTNSSAIKFYEKAGFVKYGIIPRVIFYNNHYYDEQIMVKFI